MNASKQFIRRYQNLNTQQKKAVDKIEGPVMVVAGPGTGKTELLAIRIANILLKTDIQPGNILALTFTNSGVKAIENRLIDIMGTVGYFVDVFTFHSFCNDIIMRFPDEFEFSRNLQPLDELEAVSILEKVLNQVKPQALAGGNDPFYYLQDIISAISNLKRENIDPFAFQKAVLEQKEKWEKDPKADKSFGKYIKRNEELVQIYREYESELEKRERFDYADMILKVLEKFREGGFLLTYFQEKYQYVLVDEYQDTNNAQNALVAELMSFYKDRPNIFVVGDDEQAIYRFQGASLENFLYFKNQYPHMQVVVLEKNYRNTQIILDQSRSLIRNNNLRIEKVLPDVTKKLQACRPNRQEKSLEVIEFSHEDLENHFLVQKIEQLKESGTPLSEIAIIYPKNKNRIKIMEALEKVGLPFQVSASEDILKETLVQQLLNLLKLIHDPTNDGLYFEVLHYDWWTSFDFSLADFWRVFRKLKERDREKNKKEEEKSKKEENKSYFLTFLEMKKEALEKIARDNHEGLIAFNQQLMKWHQMQYQKSLLDLFDNIIQKSSLREKILAESSESLADLILIRGVFEKIKAWTQIEPRLKLKGLIDKIEKLEEYGFVKWEGLDYHLRENALVLTTAHKAKGMEWDYVIMPQCYQGNWGQSNRGPSIRLPQGLIQYEDLSEQDEEEDQRRLFYVSLTRARKNICLTYALDYEGTVREKKRSLFIEELLQDDNLADGKKINFKKEENTTQDLKKVLLNLTDEKKIWGPDQEGFLKERIKEYYLSPTGLNNYLRCPRQFMYNNLLRAPTAMTSALLYGNAVHQSLEDYFRKFKRTKIKPPKTCLTESFSENIERFPLAEADLSLLQKKGLKELTEYFEHYQADFVLPERLEMTLKGFLKHPEIKLKGKIDKIEITPNGTKRVIDYKTGRPKTEKMIKKDNQGALYKQLVFYRILLGLNSNLPFADAEYCLDFISRGGKKKFSFYRTLISQEDIDSLKNLIREVMKKIRALEFPCISEESECRMWNGKPRCNFVTLCGR